MRRRPECLCCGASLFTKAHVADGYCKKCMNGTCPECGVRTIEVVALVSREGPALLPAGRNPMSETPVASKSETAGEASRGRLGDGDLGGAPPRDVVSRTRAKSTARENRVFAPYIITPPFEYKSDRPKGSEHLTYDPKYGFETGIMGPNLPVDSSGSGYYRTDLPVNHDEQEGATSPPPDYSVYTLPGEGFAGLNCGRTFKKKCRKCGNIWEAESTCNQRDCPYCGPHPHDYGRWAVKRAKAIRGRILDGMAFYNIRSHHVMLSPPQDRTIESKADHKRFLAEARDHMRLANIEGGVEIVHPYRSKHLDGTTCERFRCQEKHHWEPGLHLHNFCLAEWVSPGDYVYWKTGGWVLKRMDTFQPEVLDYYAYALSHCGILLDDDAAKHPLTHAAVWWGTLSYNKMPAGAFEHAARLHDPDYCPKCGSLEVSIMPQAAEKRDARYLSKLGDRPPPPAICPDCGCGDCRLVREAKPCNHVFIPDPYSPRVVRVGGCRGTCTPLIGESDMIIRCMSGYGDYLEPM